LSTVNVFAKLAKSCNAVHEQNPWIVRSKRAAEISTLGNDALGRSAWLANARLSDGITVMGGTRARPTVLAS
jgi:hypothetical protein